MKFNDFDLLMEMPLTFLQIWRHEYDSLIEQVPTFLQMEV